MGEPPDWDPGLKALGAQNLQESIGEKETLLLKNPSTKGPEEASRASSLEFPKAAAGG